ncbi:MAG: isopentenyl phosphate kinase [Anaerolineae bacterium]
MADAIPPGDIAFLKLGGSLITDKTVPEAVRSDVLERVAVEVAAALAQRPGLRLLLAHGSGSFGHVAAARYGVQRGHPADWRGYAETAAAAARLNRMVLDAFLRNGVPVVALQPSGSARTASGEIVELAAWPIPELWMRGLVPVVYGDVALDSVQGCAIISTERIFAYLTPLLHPALILLAGEVDGVYTADPHSDPAARQLARLTPSAWRATAREGVTLPLLGASRGADVTGGMRSKVQGMLDLVQRYPGLRVRVFSGLEKGRVAAALLGEPVGTLLAADES